MSRARRSRPARRFRAIPRPIVGHVLPPELRAPCVAAVAATLPDGVRDPGFEILLRRIDGAPLLPAREVEPYFRGHEAFVAMRAAIRAAREEVLLESYFFKDDEVGRELATDLAQAASRGVAVRVLADAFGSFSTRRAFWATRRVLLGPALLLAAAAACYALLPPAAERPGDAPHAPLTPASRGILWSISSLFALDAVSGGFLTSALLSYFFFERFGASEAAMGALFFGARVLNAASHWGAARLARRFGLVNTMVFTHVPSSLLLLTVAFAPSFPVAAVLFLLREGLVEMDVLTRTSYVLAVVRPEERTLASGVTSLVRLGGWALAPFLAGALMQGSSLAAPLVVGAGMKIAYDVLLYASFRGLPAPEERAATPASDD